MKVMNPLMNKAEYEKLQSEILSWLPPAIIDAHVHSSLALYEKPQRQFNKNLQIIYREDQPTLTSKTFGPLYPATKIIILGVPLPYSEAVPNRVNKDMQKQDNPVLLLDDNVYNLRQHLAPNVIGLKAHWKLHNKPAGFSDIISEEKATFLEKNNLLLLIECSDPPKSFDALVEADKTYTFPIILPHMAFNHEGFVMSAQQFMLSLTHHAKQYDVLNTLSDTDHIYFDVSMKPNYDLLQTGMAALGEKKILFGTDFPFGLTPKFQEDREKITNDAFWTVIRNIILGKRSATDWLYYKNIYLLLWVLKQLCETMDVDKEVLLLKNAQHLIKR